MIIANSKPVKIIGYTQSSLTKEYYNFLSAEHNNSTKIITPEEFISIKNKKEFQYINAFSLDRPLRKIICDDLDDLNLDCVTYIHDTCVVSPGAEIKKGSFIGPFSVIGFDSQIQQHCFISAYCGIGHETVVGRNTIIQAGVKIAGNTTIGENCLFNFGSSALNKLTITDNVILGAYSNLTKDAAISGTYIGTIARRVK